MWWPKVPSFCNWSTHVYLVYHIYRMKLGVLVFELWPFFTFFCRKALVSFISLWVGGGLFVVFLHPKLKERQRNGQRINRSCWNRIPTPGVWTLTLSQLLSSYPSLGWQATHRLPGTGSGSGKFGVKERVIIVTLGCDGIINTTVHTLNTITFKFT